MAYKFVQQSTLVADAVSMAFGELQALAEECREIVDNASEGLSQTQRIQTFSDTADALENGSSSEPDVPQCLAEKRMEWIDSVNRRKGSGPSRAVRCSNAVSALSAVVTVCEETLESLEDGDQKDDIESFRDQCQSTIDEVEGCEFPGMYG